MVTAPPSTSPAPQAQAPNPAHLEIQRRMNLIAADGRLCGCHEATVQGEEYVVSIASLRGELLLTFTSYERPAGPGFDETVNGRSVHGRCSHQRRILVDGRGNMYLEAGRVVLLTANNKYESPAKTAIQGHLTAMRQAGKAAMA